MIFSANNRVIVKQLRQHWC